MHDAVTSRLRSGFQTFQTGLEQRRDYGPHDNVGSIVGSGVEQLPPPTFLAALRQDSIDAPCVFDGPINGERFRLYVDKMLVPVLKTGDIVVMDNLGSHKGKAVRQAIRQTGARLLFLPKYSPDLNPIEQLFAKIKHWLRKAVARSVDTVCSSLGATLGRISAQECKNYFDEAGYERT